MASALGFPRWVIYTEMHIQLIPCLRIEAQFHASESTFPCDVVTGDLSGPFTKAPYAMMPLKHVGAPPRPLPSNPLTTSMSLGLERSELLLCPARRRGPGRTATQVLSLPFRPQQVPPLGPLPRVPSPAPCRGRTSCGGRGL